MNGERRVEGDPPKHGKPRDAADNIRENPNRFGSGLPPCTLVREQGHIPDGGQGMDAFLEGRGYRRVERTPGPAETFRGVGMPNGWQGGWKR